MTDTLDFLFNGNAPPSTTNYGSTVQNVPTWLSDFTQGLIARANAVGAEGYQQYGGPRVADMSPDSSAAFDMVRQNVGAYAPAIDNAISGTSAVPGSAAGWFGSANRNLGAAGALTQRAVGPNQGGLAAASPWLSAASGSFTGQTADSYMNPYVQNVIQRSADLANRNFYEQIMPGIRNEFVGAGQFGSDRNQEFVGRAARDVTQNIQDTANATLANAYGAGQNAFSADASRMAGLAGTAGGLGSQQQSAMLSAGQQLGQLGAQYGTTGQQQGQLGLDAAKQQGALAQAAQQMGVTDAAQLNAIGQQQQDLLQRRLDLGYQDFQNATNYPRTTLDWMSNIIRGLPTSTATNTSVTQPASTYQPSPLSQLGSLATGLTGLSRLNQNGTSGYARGGRVHYARGGLAALPKSRVGALAYAHR